MIEESNKLQKVCDLIDDAKKVSNLTGDSDHAAHFIDEAVLTDPVSQYALITKSKFLAERGRYDEANLYLNRILTTNPLDVETLFEKGRLFASVGLHTEAARYFEEEIRIREEENIKRNAGYWDGYLEWNNERSAEFELERRLKYGFCMFWDFIESQNKEELK